MIAEFKDDSWRQLGTLAKGRRAQGSIALGDKFMVIGGGSYDGRFVYFYDYFLKIIFFSETETEIWNATNETYEVVNPTFPNFEYAFGVGFFIVPFNFCTT